MTGIAINSINNKNNKQGSMRVDIAVNIRKMLE